MGLSSMVGDATAHRDEARAYKAIAIYLRDLLEQTVAVFDTGAEVNPSSLAAEVRIALVQYKDLDSKETE